MSLKAKLTSMMVAIVLVLAALTIGVLAVKQTNLNIGGTINFKANGINATVSAGVVEGGAVEGTDKMQALTYSTTTAVTNNEASWSDLVLNMDESGTMTIKFTVTNTSTKDNDPLYATFDVTSTNTNVNVEVTSDGAEEIPSKTNNVRNITITFTLSDGVEVDGSESFTINCELAKEVVNAGVSLDFNVGYIEYLECDSINGAVWKNSEDASVKFKKTADSWKGINLKFAEVGGNIAIKLIIDASACNYIFGSNQVITGNDKIDVSYTTESLMYGKNSCTFNLSVKEGMTLDQVENITITLGFTPHGGGN